MLLIITLIRKLDTSSHFCSIYRANVIKEENSGFKVKAKKLRDSLLSSHLYNAQDFLLFYLLSH